jgi:murein L,D-transpeptidase YafK
LNRRPLVRSLLASAAIVAAVVLAGCDTDSNAPTLRSLQPLSQQMITEIERRNMSKESPILVRIFKEESELELWKEDQSGRMALLKTYPICRWSGDLGPKFKEGDRQAPEGFYTITPSLMNPNSSFYLSINMGYPNAYDRANNRTGAFLMIHGDCSSRGCYAMTDEQIAEIYALARESFFGGQGSFQIQAFPFRMTPQNMARHRNSPHMAFWRMLKVGYDHFEVTRQEPKVDVCDRRYVFNTETNGRYNPTAACPVMTTPDDVLAAVKTKQQRDEAQVADLVRRGNLPAVRSFADGGMHATFIATLQSHNVDDDGVVRARTSSPNGTIPANVRIPPEQRTVASRAPARTTTGSASEPVVRADTPRTETRVAAAQPSASSGSGSGFLGNLFSSNSTSSNGSQSSSGGIMDQMARMVGLGGSSTPDNTASAQKAKSAPKQQTAARSKPAEEKKSATKPANSATRPADSAQQPAAPAEQPAPPRQNTASGTPPASINSFENRFGAWR